MRKIALPHEGLDTLYGAHDANLKHIESLLDVEIRTQGDELIVEGEKSGEQRVEHLFEQLTSLLSDGYDLASADVKTAAGLVVVNPKVDLRERDGMKLVRCELTADAIRSLTTHAERNAVRTP